MNTDFPLKAQDAIIGDVIIYPEMDMSRTDKYDLSIDQLPVGLIAQLVRALHWYRRGHGFDSRSSLNFFSGFFLSTA